MIPPPRERHVRPYAQRHMRSYADIDALYREWARNRTDVERLRRLHAAIGECLQAVETR